MLSREASMLCGGPCRCRVQTRPLSAPPSRVRAHCRGGDARSRRGSPDTYQPQHPRQPVTQHGRTPITLAAIANPKCFFRCSRVRLAIKHDSAPCVQGGAAQAGTRWASQGYVLQSTAGHGFPAVAANRSTSQLPWLLGLHGNAASTHARWPRAHVSPPYPRKKLHEGHVSIRHSG